MAKKIKTPAPEMVQVCCEGLLNLRCGPGKEFPAATTLAPGTKLRILGEPDEVLGWAPVLCVETHQLGWVAAEYVEAITEEDTHGTDGDQA